ncbi:MAG: ATP-binding protein [Oscillospiraceae bacterium]|nr:ATP-binding protein [Oscillospiraceae bacterium]
MNDYKRPLLIDDYISIVFDSAPISANLWNKELELILCNKAALKMFDITDMDLYLKRFDELSPEHQPCGTSSVKLRLEKHKAAFKSGYEKFEWMHQSLDGKPIPCEITLIRIEHEGVFHMAAYKRDLREQKRTEEATIANNAKSRLLATVSHEIRTPMNAILGVAEIQLLNHTLPQEAKEAFGLIYDSSNLLINIINDILDFSKIEAGKLELSIDKYEIPSVINDAAQLICHRYESVSIEFILNIDEKTPLFLRGDEIRIKQILNNLLSNAFKYTEEGFVKFFVFSEPADKERFGDGFTTLVLQVSDSGKGMDKEQIDRLFDEYTRFNNQASKYSDGTGLGMSITKRLVNLMEGEITVESEVGAGTTFTVRLPQERIGDSLCGKGVERNLKEPYTQRNTQVSKIQFTREYMPYGSVLIVDDVDTNLYVAEGMLIPYGLKTETVSSGIDAIKKIEKGNVYDIIFMDHMMPQMNGVEATKILRDMGYNRAIIALTANAVAGQSDMFMANGFDGFISKPVDARELNALLKNFIRDKQTPEVIRAARNEKRNVKGDEVMNNAPGHSTVPERIKKAFLSDAKRIVEVLEELLPKLHQENEEDIQSYVVSVHGIKNALVIVNEKLVSALAYKLEHEGRNHNIKALIDETPALLSELRRVIAELEPEGSQASDPQPSDDDIAFLRTKMLLIMTACSASDRRMADTVLEELGQKNWSGHIKRDLEAVSASLLRGDFEKALRIAAGIIGE